MHINELKILPEKELMSHRVFEVKHLQSIRNINPRKRRRTASNLEIE